MIEMPTMESRICNAVVTDFYKSLYPYCNVEYNQFTIEYTGGKEVRHAITLVRPKDNNLVEPFLRGIFAKILFGSPEYKFNEETIPTKYIENPPKKEYVTKRYVLHKCENPCHPSIV